MPNGYLALPTLWFVSKQFLKSFIPKMLKFLQIVEVKIENAEKYNKRKNEENLLLFVS